MSLRKKIIIAVLVIIFITLFGLIEYSHRSAGVTPFYRYPEIIGIDGNQNGVRDDVEVYIDTTYATVEGTREKLIILVTPEPRVKQSFEEQGMLDEYNRRREKEKAEITTAISTPADVSNLRNALRQEYKAALAQMLANTDEEVGKAADMAQYAAGCLNDVISKPNTATIELSADLNKIILNTSLRKEQFNSFYKHKLLGTAKYQNHSFDNPPCDFQLAQ